MKNTTLKTKGKLRKMNSKKVAFLAVGQCGANIVSGFEGKGYSAFYINTSQEDLATLTNAAHTFQLTGASGCNKDRGKAKSVLAENLETVISEIRTKLTEPIIFVAFSCGGGTGSGIAPFLIDILQQETDKIICAIGVLPAESESIKSHVNSYESCRELADIENMGCTFFLDNNRMANKFTINTIFVGLLDSLLSNRSISTKGNIDGAEIEEMLKTKGMSIISKLGRDKAQTAKLIETFHNNIFAPMETDRSIKYVGIVNSTDELNLDSIYKEIGTPLDVFQGYESPVTVAILTGLTFPFTRIIAIRDLVKENQSLISKNLQATSQNRLTEEINFLDSVACKKPEVKKMSSRDALMQFKKR